MWAEGRDLRGRGPAIVDDEHVEHQRLPRGSQAAVRRRRRDVTSRRNKKNTQDKRAENKQSQEKTNKTNKTSKEGKMSKAVAQEP